MSQHGLDELRELLRTFAQKRDWEQFHTPKNLAMALTVEASELLEIFQWLTVEESSAVMTDDATRAAVLDEVADVLIYLVRMADVLDIDLVEAALEKIRRNEERFPAN